MSKAYKVDRTNGDVALENDSVVTIYDSIDDAELDINNIEEGQIIGTNDNIDTRTIEEEIKADLDEYAENLMQSYGQAVGSYLTMEDNSVIPQGYLLANGRDTTGTDDELSTKYPLLYAYLGNTNVLPAEFDHSVLGLPEDISTSLNHTTTSSYYTVPYDGYIIINWTPANRYKSVYWSDDGINWTEFVYNLDVSAYQTTTVPVKKGDMLYLRDAVADNVIYARFYKQYKYIKTVSGIETGSTEAQEVANAVSTIEAFVSNAEKYSTTEVKTNKTWIDGKPIYRVVHKIWENGSAASGYTYSSNILSGPLTENAETLVSSYTMNKGTGGRWAMMATTGEGGPAQAWYWLTDNSAYYNYGATVSLGYAIIEYTKTTD